MRFKNTLTCKLTAWLLLGWLITKEFLNFSGVFCPFKDVGWTDLSEAADKWS